MIKEKLQTALWHSPHLLLDLRALTWLYSKLIFFAFIKDFVNAETFHFILSHGISGDFLEPLHLYSLKIS